MGLAFWCGIHCVKRSVSCFSASMSVGDYWFYKACAVTGHWSPERSSLSAIRFHAVVPSLSDLPSMFIRIAWITGVRDRWCFEPQNESLTKIPQILSSWKWSIIWHLHNKIFTNKHPLQIKFKKKQLRQVCCICYLLVQLQCWQI